MRYLLGLLAALLFATAMDARAQALRLGVEAGPALISIDYVDPHTIWNPTHRFSYGVKVFAERRLREFMSLRGGLRYVVLGGRVDYSSELVREERAAAGEIVGTRIETLNGRFDITQSYVSIPLQLALHPRVLPFDVHIGPEVGYLFAADLENRQREPQVQHEEQDILDNMDRLNVAATVGVARSAQIAGSTWRVGLHYAYGLTGTAGKDWLSDWSTRELGLTLGILF